MYILKTGEIPIYLAVYVDDITIAGNDIIQMKKIKDQIQDRFKITDQGSKL